MNNTIIQLVKRRAALIEKIENQRMALAETISPLHSPLSLADKGLHVVRYLSTHPVLVAGIATVVVMTRPKRWFFVLGKGWKMWRLVLAARQKFASLD
jgi:hypothetical protein